MTTQADSTKKLYVACSLTHSSEVFKAKVETFKTVLRNQGYEVLDFVGLIKGTARDVYEWDVQHCLSVCDGCIAICDEASIGLGWELGEAVRLGKPCLAVAHEKIRVTRVILGAAEVEPNLRFVTYRNLVQDVLPLVDELFVARI